MRRGVNGRQAEGKQARRPRGKHAEAQAEASGQHRVDHIGAGTREQAAAGEQEQIDGFENQGQTYFSFIESELKVERERRSTFDARGVAFVKTSGSLVTLLVAIGAVVAGEARFTAPKPAVVPLLAALLSFAAAAGFGLLASWPYRHTVADVADLQQMRTDRWGDDEIDARNVIAYLNIDTIRTLRHGNDVKATLLMGAQVAQLFALCSLAFVIGVVVWPR